MTQDEDKPKYDTENYKDKHQKPRVNPSALER